MIVNFVGIKILWTLFSFLSMIIYEVLGVVFNVYNFTVPGIEI